MFSASVRKTLPRLASQNSHLVRPACYVSLIYLGVQKTPPENTFDSAGRRHLRPAWFHLSSALYIQVGNEQTYLAEMMIMSEV